jgi:hypothetical protein
LICGLVQSGFQTAALITMADRPDGLRSERYGNPRRGGPFRQLQQRQGSQDGSNLLYATAQQRNDYSLILWRDINAQWWTTHASSMRQTILHENGLRGVLSVPKARREKTSRTSATCSSIAPWSPRPESHPNARRGCRSRSAECQPQSSSPADPYH